MKIYLKKRYLLIELLLKNLNWISMKMKLQY
jgi:hypothetical protein